MRTLRFLNSYIELLLFHCLFPTWTRKNENTSAWQLKKVSLVLLLCVQDTHNNDRYQTEKWFCHKLLFCTHTHSSFSTISSFSQTPPLIVRHPVHVGRAKTEVFSTFVHAIHADYNCSVSNWALCSRLRNGNRFRVEIQWSYIFVFRIPDDLNMCVFVIILIFMLKFSMLVESLCAK